MFAGKFDRGHSSVEISSSQLCTKLTKPCTSCSICSETHSDVSHLPTQPPTNQLTFHPFSLSSNCLPPHSPTNLLKYSLIQSTYLSLPLLYFSVACVFIIHPPTDSPVIYPSIISLLHIIYSLVYPFSFHPVLTETPLHVKHFDEFSEEFRVEENAFSGAPSFVITLKGGRNR